MNTPMDDIIGITLALALLVFIVLLAVCTVLDAYYFWVVKPRRLRESQAGNAA